MSKKDYPFDFTDDEIWDRMRSQAHLVGVNHASVTGALSSKAVFDISNNELQRRYTKRASTWSIVALCISTLSFLVSSFAAYFAYQGGIQQENQYNELKTIREAVTIAPSQESLDANLKDLRKSIEDVLNSSSQSKAR